MAAAMRVELFSNRIVIFGFPARSALDLHSYMATKASLGQHISMVTLGIHEPADDIPFRIDPN